MSSPPTGYRLSSYGEMINCQPRMGPYAEALKAAVKPGSVVFDIGAGVGAFALLACRYGAAEVVAIDPDPSIEILRKAAVENGFANRIRIFRGLSSDFIPQRRADVIVSDLRGIVPLFESHIPAVIDVRERLLAPGGILIPKRDRLFAALWENEEHFQQSREPWLSNRYDLDYRGTYRHVANRERKVEVKPAEILGPPKELAVLDYSSIASPDLDAQFVLVAEREGRCHGLVLWFDSELADGIGFSNAPAAPRLIYGQLCLPLERPLLFAEGDRVEGNVSARLVGGQYIWTWAGVVKRLDGNTDSEFRQSTFFRDIFSPDDLRRHASTSVPVRNEAVAADRRILELIDGERSLAEIAATVRFEYPACFPDAGDAMDRAAALAGAYVEMKDE